MGGKRMRGLSSRREEIGKKRSTVFLSLRHSSSNELSSSVGVKSGVASRGAERRGMGGLGGGIFFFPCGSMRTVHSGVFRGISTQVQATKDKMVPWESQGDGCKGSKEKNYHTEGLEIRLFGDKNQARVGKVGEKSSGRMMQRQRQELAPEERA